MWYLATNLTNSLRFRLFFHEMEGIIIYSTHGVNKWSFLSCFSCYQAAGTLLCVRMYGCVIHAWCLPSMSWLQLVNSTIPLAAPPSNPLPNTHFTNWVFVFLYLTKERSKGSNILEYTHCQGSVLQNSKISFCLQDHLRLLWGHNPWLMSWLTLSKHTMLPEAVNSIYFSSSDICTNSKGRDGKPWWLLGSLCCSEMVSVNVKHWRLKVAPGIKGMQKSHSSHFAMVLWFSFFIFKCWFLLTWLFASLHKPVIIKDNIVSQRTQSLFKK